MDKALDPSEKRFGFGHFCPSLGIRRSIRINDYATIFTSEAYAVSRALNISKEIKRKKVLIVTNSLIALVALKKL